MENSIFHIILDSFYCLYIKSYFKRKLINLPLKCRKKK